MWAFFFIIHSSTWARGAFFLFPLFFSTFICGKRNDSSSSIFFFLLLLQYISKATELKAILLEWKWALGFFSSLLLSFFVF
jgi:hypothetical protein